MPRYKLLVEYDGTPYHGFQRQGQGLPSVQEKIEDALEGLSGERLTLRAAGRTDTGVHAQGQVCHIDLPKWYAADKVRDALNYYLKGEMIVILEANEVPQNFDSRFSAIRRVYRYRLLDRRAPTGLDRYRVWHVPVPLDVEAMQLGANRMIGHLDFTTFRSTHCQAKSPWKTMEILTVTRQGQEIWFDLEARSFLHNQVRSMVGSLKLVGTGQWTPDDITRILEARDRKACGPVAPPYGLSLMRVDYIEGATAPVIMQDDDESE